MELKKNLERDFRFWFGNKQCGYCVMTHQEASLLLTWQRKHEMTGRIEGNNLKLRYLAELIHMREKIGGKTWIKLSIFEKWIKI